MISRIKNKASSLLSRLDVHTLEVVKKSSASMVVKVGGMIVGLGVSLFIGRTLGPEGLGIINLTTQIVGLFMVITMLGMPQVVLKYTAIAFDKKNWERVGDTMFTATTITGCIALILTLTGLLITPYLVNLFKQPQLEIPLVIAFITLIPRTLSRIFASGLNGFRKIWQSNLLNETLSIWIVGASLLGLWLFKVEVDVIKVAVIYAIGRIIASIAIVFYWKKLYHFKSKKKWIAKSMTKMAMPMLMVTSAGACSTYISTILLGWLGTTEDVGLFSVASQIALLTSFFLVVTNSAISPKLALLHASGKKKELEQMAQSVTRGLLGFAILSLLLLVVFGEELLGLWGHEFKEVYWVLVILGIGQFVNISAGCVGLLLIMCGQEKIQGRISICMLVLNILLACLLILSYGIIGNAIATATTLITQNILMLYFVQKKIGIRTIILKNPFRFNKAK